MHPLKEVRTRQRVTVRDLAKRADISTNTIVRIEGGQVKQGDVRLSTQKKIASALGVHPDAITEFYIPGDTDTAFRELASAQRDAFQSAVAEADRDGWLTDEDILRLEQGQRVKQPAAV